MKIKFVFVLGLIFITTGHAQSEKARTTTTDEWNRIHNFNYCFERLSSPDYAFQLNAKTGNFTIVNLNSRDMAIKIFTSQAGVSIEEDGNFNALKDHSRSPNLEMLSAIIVKRLTSLFRIAHQISDEDPYKSRHDRYRRGWTRNQVIIEGRALLEECSSINGLMDYLKPKMIEVKIISFFNLPLVNEGPVWPPPGNY